MPVNSADQGLVLPIQADAANQQTAFASYSPGVEGRLVKRYVDAADRTARNPTPTAGEVSYLTTPGRHDFYSSAAAWWELRPLFVRKTAETQVVNNSTTLVNDDALIIAMQINARYVLQGLVVVDTGTTSDFKAAWTVPAGGAIGKWTLVGQDASSNFNRGSISAATAVTIAGAGIGTFIYIPVCAIVTTAGTAGNLTFQWAQNTVEAVNTRVKTDSWLTLTRVG